jgi:hypothetical protein
MAIIPKPLTFTVAGLLAPPSYDTVKQGTFQSLINAGFTAIQSYAPTSLPVALVESESAAQDQFNQEAAFIVQAGYNTMAAGDALTLLSSEVYQNDRLPGNQARGFFTITDTRGVGPRTFSAASVAFAVGALQFNGVVIGATATAPAVADPVTLPKNGSCKVYVQAAAVGDQYNLGAGSTIAMTKGVIPGVTVSNAANWQQDQYGVVGTPQQGDPQLQQENTTQWETLSAGATPGRYANAALKNSEVTRVRTDTNLDLTDPGRIDVTIAGPAGGVSGAAVTAVQLSLAPNQIGGPNIPETAKVVVTSAANLVVAVAGVLVVDGNYNNATFLQQVVGDLQTWFSSFLIGGGKLGKVSYDRIVGILTYRAGLTNGVVFDGSNITVNGGAVDLPIAYNQVPIPDISGLSLQAL